MPPLFEMVTNLCEGAETLRRRSYGVIEAADGRFCRVVLRPFPKLVSLPDVLVLGRWRHQRTCGDRSLLYYNQPRRCRNFLAVTYVVSSKGTSCATLKRLLEALDEIARLKQSDALVCDVSNGRLSRQVLARLGWEPHCPSRWHRHYIRRFYGTYPEVPAWIAPSAEICGV